MKLMNQELIVCNPGIGVCSWYLSAQFLGFIFVGDFKRKQIKLFPCERNYVLEKLAI